MTGQPPIDTSGSAGMFAPQPGDVLVGKYRVESTLGAGGMGVVLLVQHIELGQRMAVKLMMPGVHHDHQAIARFLREARAAAGIQSEHVVRIFDVGTLETGSPYMVMELLRGEDLGQLLTSVTRLPIHEAVDYVLQACHAIAEAHAMGIVHRDLKPSNLFLTRRSDGSPLVKVLDFGISKAMEQEGQAPANLTQTSAVMGSPLYMSPEQVRNAKQVDVRADIWSLGVILHELLTGAPAFNADTLPGICAAIIADEPAPLRTLRDDAPAELESIVSRCLEKSVTRRYQSVRDLMAELRVFSSSGLQLSPGSKPIATTLPSSNGSKVLSDSSKNRGSVRDPVVTAASRRDLPASLRIGATTRSADPVSAGAQSSRSASSGKGRTIAIAAGVLAVVGVVAAALVLRRAPSAAPAPAAAQTPTAEVPAARKTFTLFIDSTPSGAEVSEGDKVLGSTPIQISVDNEAARQGARKITVHREGFQPYSILQGPSEDNVRIIAPLVQTPAEPPVAKGRPLAAAPPTPAHPAKPAKPAAAPVEPAPPPAAPTPPAAPPANPADIRLQR